MSGATHEINRSAKAAVDGSDWILGGIIGIVVFGGYFVLIDALARRQSERDIGRIIAFLRDESEREQLGATTSHHQEPADRGG